MSDNKKGFKAGLYAVIVFVLIAAFLAITVTTTFSSKYMGFHPDTIAENYVDTIVQKGDGYNSYKYTLVSQGQKYGDYVRQYYMYPVIYSECGYDAANTTSDERKKMKGFNDDSFKSEKTENDDGTLSAELTEKMYPYYEELMAQYGWDNYDAVFTNYFTKLKEVRATIYGDQYLSDEVMFTALEANVDTYGSSLAGQDAIYDNYDNSKIITPAVVGLYGQKYGEDYIFVTESTSTELSSDDMTAYIASMNTDMLSTYDVNTEDIKAVNKCDVTVKLTDGTAVVTQEVYVVKIGNAWYVDNTTVNTSNLYNFYK